MKIHHASCLCGQLKISCEGEPVRISVCHCLNCQKRSGSAFASQARWPEESVQSTGNFREYMRAGESGKVCAKLFPIWTVVIDHFPARFSMAKALVSHGFPSPSGA